MTPLARLPVESRLTRVTFAPALHWNESLRSSTGRVDGQQSIRRAVLLDLLDIVVARAGKADEFPAGEIAVAAIHRVGQKAFSRVLQQHREDIFVASGEEIEAWWRARDRVTQKVEKGPATKLVFDVRSPGNVKGVTFFATHAVAEGVLKAVKPAKPDAPQPELKRIDAYRSAIIFRQELKAGRYEYSLEF